uniref:Phospholipase-like protein n=1 Tax=Tanacetum cinerariifolium TaxID=118510 RepID=A0A6L2LTE6_TANCI|nr:phospholipase-like protein [Tanacetum cinerariifolium]
MLDEDVVRLCLLIASELVFMGKEKRNFLTKHLMWLVDDFDAWNTFPWGKRDPHGLAWSKVTMFEKSDYEELFGPMSNLNVALISSPEEMSQVWFKASAKFIKGLDDQDDTFFQDDLGRDKCMEQHNGMCGDTEDDDGDGVLDSQTKDVIEEATMLPTMSSNSLEARNAAVSDFFAEFDALKKNDCNPKKSDGGVSIDEKPNFSSHHNDSLNHIGGVSSEAKASSSSAHPGNDEDVSHLDDNMEINENLSIDSVVAIPLKVDDPMLHSIKPKDDFDEADVLDSYDDDYMSLFNDEEQPAKSSLNDLELQQEPDIVDVKDEILEQQANADKGKTTVIQETVGVPVKERPSLGRGLGTLKFKKKNCERALRPNYVLRSAKIRKKKMVMSLKSPLQLSFSQKERQGYLRTATNSHLNLWIDLMWSLRLPKADWAIVYFLVNEPKEHWCLAQLEIRTRVVTFYDSLGWAGGSRRCWWRRRKKVLPEKLTPYLLMHVKEKKDDIFISQDKYVAESLKKFRFTKVRTASTPMETQKPLLKDEDAYTDSDYARANLDRKSTTGSCQFLRYGKEIVIIESSVRRDLQLADEEGIDCLPNSTIFEQLALMGVTPLFQTMVIQNQSEMGEGSAMPTDPHHTPTILQPSLSQPQKTQKPKKPKRKDTQVPQPSSPTESVVNEAVHKELGDSLVRAATTSSSLEVEQDSGNINKTQSKATPNESSSQGTNSGGGPRCQETIRDTTAQSWFVSVSKHSNDSLLARAKVESSNNKESLGEDASKQGRGIDASDARDEITLVNDADNEMLDVDDLGGEVRRCFLQNKKLEDLEDLYKLVKARYGSTRPVENLDYLLWSDLKTMFEPHVEDEIWKMQHGYKVLEWKLYDSCGVHSLMMQSMQIYMLVEKKYPLTPPTLSMMLEKKLQIDYESEMAYQLCKMIKKQLKKISTASVLQRKYVKCLRLLVQKLMLLVEVKTASTKLMLLKEVKTACTKLMMLKKVKTTGENILTPEGFADPVMVDPYTFMVDPSVVFSADDPSKFMGLVSLVDALLLSNPRPILQLEDF